MRAVTSEFLIELAAITGANGTLVDPADRAGYAGDASVHSGADFLAVARPRTTAEVSAILALATRHGIVVTPRGGGSGLVGGATPIDPRPGIVLSLDRMNALRNLDPVGNTMTLESGVTLHAAQQYARDAGRLLGMEHGGGGSSQIGGNLSTNSGGNNVVRYGMAREQVLGIEAVLMDGTVLDLLYPLRKNNSGYDLKQLLLGAEGTLGVITAATLRLRPAPVHRATAFIGFETLTDALAMLPRAQGELGECITAFELIPGGGVEFHFAYVGARREPFSPLTPWAVLIEVDTAARGFDVESALTDLLAAAMEEGLVVNGAIATSDAQRREFWKLREGLAVAMVESKAVLKSDTAVPIAAIADFIASAITACQAIVPNCRCVPFGHVGDGNIHFNVLPAPGQSDDDFNAVLHLLAAAVEDTAIALGGTVSAEHGIGIIKRDALRRMRPAVQIDLMRQLKAMLDPHNLLNPGKIF